MDTGLIDTVWSILSGTPIKILDEESHSVLENELWELVSVRTDGAYSSTRIIGSANIALAFNIVHQTLVIDRIRKAQDTSSLSECAEVFSGILQHLQEEKLIRKKPHRVRQTFQLLTANS